MSLSGERPARNPKLAARRLERSSANAQQFGNFGQRDVEERGKLLLGQEHRLALLVALASRFTGFPAREDSHRVAVLFRRFPVVSVLGCRRGR
eukprot:2848787-Rhodomonas_salina.2